MSSTATLDPATDCFARGGCLVTPDATAVHGREAIRSLLAQMIDRGTEIEVGVSDLLEAGESAIAYERWRIRSLGAEGAFFVQERQATMALCRVEGDWKLSILAPWGWGAPPPLGTLQTTRRRGR